MKTKLFYFDVSVSARTLIVREKRYDFFWFLAQQVTAMPKSMAWLQRAQSGRSGQGVEA